MMNSRGLMAAVVSVAAILLLPSAPAPAATPKPAASAEGVTVKESARKAVLVVRLSRKATRKTPVAWSTSPGSAKAGADYRTSRGQAVVKKGARTARITVVVVDDAVAEPLETFFVRLSSRAARVTTPKVAVRIKDDDGGPDGSGSTRFPQTITGPVSGATKTAVFSGGTVPDSLHVEWSGTITYTFQRNDPVLGTPWNDRQLHYAITSASISWTASGTCTGAGTLTGSQLTGDFTVDDAKVGPGFDEDSRYWDYAIYVAPETGTGDMPVSCSGNPGNAAGRVGQGGFGGALVYNGYASADQPASNRYSTDRFHYAGTANPPALTYDNTWALTGSGTAAY